MADAEEGKKGGKKKLIIGVVGLVAVAGGAYFFLLGGGGGEPVDPEAATTTTVVVEGAVIEAGQLTVNLADEETRYARLNFAVVLAMGADSAVVGERIPLLQDAALSVLTGYTSADLLAADGLDRLRGELSESALEIYADGEVLRVVLTEVIVQ